VRGELYHFEEEEGGGLWEKRVSIEVRRKDEVDGVGRDARRESRE
jgi:hypothetical protein